MSGQQEQAQTPQLETPSNPVVPPVQQPLGLPIVLQTVIISPQEQWPDWRNIHRTERQRAKQECIDWMIAGWQERSLEKKALMKAFLYGQPDPSRVFEIAYSPHFQDLLNELAQSPAFSKW